MCAWGRAASLAVLGLGLLGSRASSRGRSGGGPRAVVPVARTATSTTWAGSSPSRSGIGSTRASPSSRPAPVIACTCWLLASLTGGLGRLAATVATASGKWKIGRDKQHAGILFVYAQDMDLLHVDTLLGAEIPAVEKGIERAPAFDGPPAGRGRPGRCVRAGGQRDRRAARGKAPARAPGAPSRRSGSAPRRGGPRGTWWTVPGMLSPATVESLNAALYRHEQETSNQVVVHTIPSLGGEAIETYSIRLATELKAGQKGKDNGVLLLVARDDRKVRIEVGYGLEGALPDVLCARIIRDEIVPRFKQGDMDGGRRGGSGQGPGRHPRRVQGERGRPHAAGFRLPADAARHAHPAPDHRRRVLLASHCRLVLHRPDPLQHSRQAGAPRGPARRALHPLPRSRSTRGCSCPWPS